MVVVAIAGGTGAVGRTVLDAIAKAGRHKPIVLSRTTAESTSAGSPKRIAVDYNNVEQMKQVLKDHNVQVVVSALVLVDEASTQSQINLIRAAAQSGTVDRFIPSEFYLDFHKPIPGSDLFSDFQPQCEAELDQHPQLTYTLLRAGLFMDHLSMPYNTKTTYLADYYVFVDMRHQKCVFPGDGSQPLILTHSTDVGAYIERLIGLPAKEWPRETLAVSNRLQVRDLEQIVKRATGTSFETIYDSEENVRKGKITLLPSNKSVFANPNGGEFLREVEFQLMLSMLSHAHDLPGTDLAELFPDSPRTNIEDFLRAGWQLKQTTAS